MDRELLRTIPGYDPIATAADAWFDDAAAELALEFFPEVLKHVEGDLADQPFRLERWQQAIIANLFGWKRRDRRGRTVRRYRQALVLVPRKNGKTPLAAGIGLFCLFCDREAGAQCYCAAADREQASFLYRQMEGMIAREPMLAARCELFSGGGNRSIVLKDDPAAFFRVLSADAHTKHGGNSHLVIVDELHAQPARDLVDVLTSSMASDNRKQPLFLAITTADFARPSICNELHDYAEKIRDGIVEDPAFLPVLYQADKDDDWAKPETWAKANPNLGVSVSPDYLEREAKKAREIPAYQNTFLRLHLNIRTEQDKRWLPLDAWDACPTLADEAALDGRECWGGLDLSTTTDLTAWVLAFHGEAGQIIVRPRFWCPADNATRREKRDRVPYTAWIRDGWIEATPGNVIDYDRIRAAINEDAARFNIREVAADRWNATQIIQQLAGDGLTIFPFGQGYKDMSSPSKELERLIVSGKLIHNNHPVLRWMAAAAAAEIDAAGNVKPSKAKSSDRIDGIVAAIMALARATIRPDDAAAPQVVPL